MTFDLDWAPDFVINYVSRILIDNRIRATFFVTHSSQAVDFLARHSDLFELGIHPNFLPNSTQGNIEENILKHCLELVPDAKSMRTHSLVQSTPLLGRIMTQTYIVCDVSLYLPHAPLVSPVEYWWQNRMLLRIPFIWEDDLEMERRDPCWSLLPFLSVYGTASYLRNSNRHEWGGN